MTADTGPSAKDILPPGGHRPPGYEGRIVTLLTFGNGIAALDAQAVFYLMPFIADELHVSNGQVGLIGTAVLIGWSLSAFLFGPASDHLGRRKPFLIGAYLCFAAFSGVSALVASFATLFAARLLVGLAEGPIIPIQQAVVMAESAPRRRALNMGLMQNFGSQLIGTLAAPLALVWLAERTGWRSTFLVAAVPALLVAVLIWLYMREPGTGAAREADASLSAGRLRTVLAEHNVRMCLIVTTCTVAWYFMLLTFLPLRLTRELGLAPGAMSLVMAMMGAAGMIGSILVTGLADRIGRRPIIILFSFVGALAPLGTLLFGANAWAIGAAMLVGGLMIGTISLLMGTLPQESVPPRYAATATALVLGVSQLAGGLLGPAVGGALADRYGLQAPMLLAAGLAVAAGLLAFSFREPARAPAVAGA